MTEWKFARKGTGCEVCGTSFPPESPFVSAIFESRDEEGAEFERLDACEACFAEVDRPVYSRWVTSLPPKEEKRPLLDLSLAREFLARIAKEDDPARRNVAYVLALLLLRKRKIKLVGEREESGERTMSLRLDREDEREISVRVRDPGPEEVEEITAELGRLFGLTPDADEGREPEADPGVPTDED